MAARLSEVKEGGASVGAGGGIFLWQVTPWTFE